MAWSSAAADHYIRQRRLAAMKEHQRRIECLDNLDLTGELFDRNGFDLDGFDREGYDREGYNAWGNDRWGNRRPKRNDALIEPFAWAEYLRANRLQVCQNSPDHRDEDGYDFEGYDVEGYDEDGYDRDGLHRNGFDRNGVFDPVMYHACARGKEYIRQERSLAQIAVNPDGRDDFGYDLDGYDREGYDRNGLDRNFCNRRGEYLYDR